MSVAAQFAMGRQLYGEAHWIFEWSALQHAAQLMAAGALVRTAAMDAGFADTAHLSRVLRRGFGLTPSAAIAGLGQ